MEENVQLCVAVPLIAMIAVLLLIFLIIRLLIMFCCTKAQRKKAVGKLGSLRKHDSGPMFARLEEFDVLTPLSSSIAPNTYKSYGSATPSTSSSADSRHHGAIGASSDSPPPPRRPNNGKTLIVPLNASRYRTPINMTMVGTPASYDGGTTKSCATIPEDDEDETEDLLSIDRTSLTAFDNLENRYLFPGYNLSMPQPMPEFQSTSSGFSPMLPAPTYSPPSLPSDQQDVKSPMASPVSVYETGSPHSSTASLSESFYANNFDVISSAANSQIFEASMCGEHEAVLKFQLHRIEEESEGGEETSNCGGGHDVALSGGAQFFPRSISQQFDMMRQQ